MNLRSLSLPDKNCFLAIAVSSLLAAALLLSSLLRSPASSSLLCSLTSSSPATTSPSSSLSAALLHYATSSITPQQSKSEISVSLKVLRRRSPCNFLVFGLGHDSPMWHSFNLAGTTLFLEEDPKWVQSVLRISPVPLTAQTVKYSTHLIEANDLLRSWRSVPACSPKKNLPLKCNSKCKLALSNLSDLVYEKEWDVIMIDAPRGYFNEAPGRMAAIYSAAVMARNRRGAGPTDVFLHDVNRRVEKAFAMEFLCNKYLVEGVGRLWHFRIPPVKGNETQRSDGFC